MRFDENSNRYNNQLEETSIENKISDAMILDIIMGNSQDTIYFKDLNSKFMANSKAHTIQFGYQNPKDMIGKSDFDFFPNVFAQEAYLDEIKIIETKIPIIGKLEKWVEPDGKCVWFSTSKYPIISNNGEVIGTWGISRDITELKIAQEELTQLNDKLEANNLKLQKFSDLDGLSELLNQRKFHEALAEIIEIYQRKRKLGIESTFCIILMDIDGFKLVNDQFGHPMGDKAIRFLADIIRKNKREDDICFRCGGDEFAMILLDTELKAGLYIAERLRKKIQESSLENENGKLELTISVGVEIYQEEDTLYKLLTKVDNRLYISKKNGKNQVN